MPHRACFSDRINGIMSRPPFNYSLLKYQTPAAVFARSLPSKITILTRPKTFGCRLDPFSVGATGDWVSPGTFFAA